MRKKELLEKIDALTKKVEALEAELTRHKVVDVHGGWYYPTYPTYPNPIWRIPVVGEPQIAYTISSDSTSIGEA